MLDGLCDTVSKYELAGVPSDHAAGSQPTWQWLHPKSRQLSNSTRLGKAQLKQQQRRLQNDCAQLIDKAEDELSAALQKGLSSAGSHDDIHATLASLLEWLTATQEHDVQIYRPCYAQTAGLHPTKLSYVLSCKKYPSVSGHLPLQHIILLLGLLAKPFAFVCQTFS